MLTQQVFRLADRWIRLGNWLNLAPKERHGIALLAHLCLAAQVGHFYFICTKKSA